MRGLAAASVGAAAAAAAAPRVNLHTTSFLSAPTPLNLALVVLNVDHQSRQLTAAARFNHLWQHSSVRLCADGAANRLYDSLDESVRASMLPDLIIGDLDSLRIDVSDYYSSCGVAIECVADQDSHDFEKCLRWLERRQQQPAPGAHAGRATGVPAAVPTAAESLPPPSAALAATLPQPFSVVAIGAFGGRLDQQMANLNMAYRYSQFAHFCLLSGDSLAFLLRPGKHVIEPNRREEDGSCGLIPLGGRCERVSTTGYAPPPRAHGCGLPPPSSCIALPSLRPPSPSLWPLPRTRCALRRTRALDGTLVVTAAGAAARAAACVPARAGAHAAAQTSMGSRWEPPTRVWDADLVVE